MDAQKLLLCAGRLQALVAEVSSLWGTEHSLSSNYDHELQRGQQESSCSQLRFLYRWSWITRKAYKLSQLHTSSSPVAQEAAWEGKFTVTPPHCPVLVFIPRPPFLQELSFRPIPLPCATGPPSAPPFLFPFSGNAGPCLHFSGRAHHAQRCRGSSQADSSRSKPAVDVRMTRSNHRLLFRE